MATNRPEAVPDSKLSSAPNQIKEEATENTTTTTITPPTTTNTSPLTKPLRPQRNYGAKLVRPKDEVQPAAAAASAGSCKSISGSGAGPGGGGVVGVRKSTCKRCTNISIMQLFYEMKQKFPTVPDDVVNECVLDNCHERERCMEKLREHSEGNQTNVPHSYPARLLLDEQQQHKCDNRHEMKSDRQSNTNTIPRRSRGGGGGGGAVGAAIVAAAVPLVGMVGVSGHNFRRQSDTNSPQLAGRKNAQNSGSFSDMLSNGGNFVSNNIQRMAISGGGGGGSSSSPAAGAVPANKVERPRTLNLASSPNRPFRTAPPIPSTTSSTSSLSSLSTATDLASASSPQLTASNESINVSVNVTLSPILTPRTTPSHVAKPPIPPRHTTELTVQPEMLPFATTMAKGLPSRSFTSVNFTLRPPPTSGGGAGDNGGGVLQEGEVVGAPIDFTTAGSSMTYSSSSYNAQQGYQSQLQITVGNGGGSISAYRTKAPTGVTQQQQTTAVAGRTIGGTRTTTTTTRLDADSEEILINRQLQSKWKLSTELDKYKKRLDVMQRDVKALQVPLPVSAPEQLQDEIERLQTVCDRMAAAVEQAGNFALGETNAAFYQRLDSQPGRSVNPAAMTNTATTTIGQTTTTTPTTVVTPPAMEVNGASMEDNETETEGWTCSQCTFQNHPQLNMCEQCGMVKRPPPVHRSPVMQQRQQLQQQQQPSHIPPAGIVQITSSQFIPAHGSNAAAAAAYNQTPAHLTATGVPLTNRMPAPPIPQPGYMMRTYSGHTPSPRMLYTSPMCQYPSAFSYPQIMSPSSNAASGSASPVSSTGGTYSPGQMLTPPTTGHGDRERSPKGKKKSKFNSKFSQSISNLFSSSSSSSTSTPGAASANSQE